MPGPYRCIRLTTRAWKNRLYRLPPKKDYYVYFTYVVSITTHTPVRRSSQLEKRNKEKERRQRKGKERKKKAKKQRKRKEKKRQDKKSEKRQDKERKARKGKEKNAILADPRNWLKTALGS